MFLNTMSVIWSTMVLTLMILLLLNVLLVRKHRRMQRKNDRLVSADQESRLLINCERFKISAREMDVLRLILAGHTYRSAAGSLFISEKTVDAHLRSIYAKSGVKNKVELVVKFHR